jgi:hypothetical protein
MRRLVLSAGLIGTAWAWNLAVPADAVGGWFEQTCQVPARLSCGGCAISCTAGTIPVCRNGMSVWRGATWACSFQPICACQRSPWEVWQ